jgi:sugar diacid utilization regulator
LWAIDGRPEPGAPLTADDLHLLSTTQELAASLMLDNLRIHEANQKPREAVLRRLLNATDVLGTELAELGLTADRGVTLTAFYNPRCRDSAIALAQVRNTVSKHHSSYRDETISVSLGGLIYTLIGTSDSTEVASVTERALPLIDRVVGEGSRAAIAAAVTHAGDISRSRQQLDSIMRCIEEVPEPRLLRREHVQPQLLINRVRDLITEEELVRNPLLDELSAQGNAASSELLRTLEAWCSNLGNVARTALDLGVHENTVRYRLNRLTETDRLSLEDPDVLLTTWLQLRTRAATESALPPVTQATHLSD